MGFNIKDAFNQVTDPLGVTDSQAANRANKAAQAGQAGANAQLEHDLADQFSTLSEAAQGRSLGQNLNIYEGTLGEAQKGTGEAMDIARGELDAFNPTNVEQFYNPFAEQTLARTAQAMQGGAGASLQSSATNRDIANAVSGKAADMWQQALGTAGANANNNLSVSQNLGRGAMQGANLGTMQFSAQNQPLEDLLSLKNDVAMQRYAGNIGLTQANMATVGQNQGLL